MAFSDFLKGLLRDAARNPKLQEAALGVIRGGVRKGIEHLDRGDVEGARLALAEVDDGAEHLVGAIAQNTPAEHLVDRECVANAAAACAAE